MICFDEQSYRNGRPGAAGPDGLSFDRALLETLGVVEARF
jgi:hypothetical protein